MELTEQLDSGMHTELSITNESKKFLLTTCKWAKFLAICGFVFIGFFVLLGLFIGFTGQSFQGLNDEMSFAGMRYVMMVVYILISAIYFFPTLYLYRFAVLTKQGIENTSTDKTTTGFENLKSCFKFMGVSMAIVLGFYAIIIVLGLFGALFS